MCKQHGFFDHQSYVKKSKRKQRGFFDQRNYTEKNLKNNVDFSTIEITLRKVRGNDSEIPAK